jgi:alkylated DNA repair protein (DNA oxidative demethylase)
MIELAPAVSLSLGDKCLFRFGGTTRGDATRSIKLASGDALVLSGAARLSSFTVDRIMPGISTLLAEGGRFNLTLRRVTQPAYGFGPPLDTPTLAGRNTRSPIV